MRATPVLLERAHEVQNVLGFYMGSNTQERKQYIMQHLI